MTDEEPTRGEVGLGRRILLVVGVGTVLLGGLLGAFVGANGAEVVSELTVLGILTIPLTPGAMALYGMVVTALAVTALYGAITFASKYDTNAQ